MKDHHSKFSNSSNWKEKARKFNPQATHWERGQFIEFISSCSICLDWKICMYCDYHFSLSSTCTAAVEIKIILCIQYFISFRSSRDDILEDFRGSIEIRFFFLRSCTRKVQVVIVHCGQI